MPIVTVSMLVDEFLRHWRDRLGLTQAQAAEKLGLNPRTIKRWEAGEPCQYPRLVVLACEKVKDNMENSK